MLQRACLFPLFRARRTCNDTHTVAAYITPAITLSGGKHADSNRDRLSTGQAIERTIQKYNR